MIKYWIIARKLTDVSKSFETKARVILKTQLVFCWLAQVPQAIYLTHLKHYWMHPVEVTIASLPAFSIVFILYDAFQCMKK